MCWICLDLRDGFLKPYDAILLSHDMPDRKHGEELREAIKSLDPKTNERPSESDEQQECETCVGKGLIDESLGGFSNNGLVECPDCKGTGLA